LYVTSISVVEHLGLKIICVCPPPVFRFGDLRRRRRSCPELGGRQLAVGSGRSRWWVDSRSVQGSSDSGRSGGN